MIVAAPVTVSYLLASIFSLLPGSGLAVLAMLDSMYQP
jgi:hypothetical protein